MYEWTATPTRSLWLCGGSGMLQFFERDPRTDLMSRYHDCVVKQTTVRLPEDLAEDAEAVARVKGISVNQLIVDSLAAEIDRVRSDKDFTQRARRLLDRDKELLERLAK